MAYYAIYAQIRVYLRNATFSFKSSFLCIVLYAFCVLRLILNAHAHIHSHTRMYKHRYIRTYACIHRDLQAQSHSRTYARAHTEYTSRHLRVWLLTVVVFSFVLLEQYGELYTEANDARETKCGLAHSQVKEGERAARKTDWHAFAGLHP